MLEELKHSLWNQFGASIDMLEEAIKLCPEEVYAKNKRYYYIAFHSLIFLDYYLTTPPSEFTPQLTFTIKEPADVPPEAVDDLIPDKLYTKYELLIYLRSCREKCFQLISNLNSETIKERFIEEFDEDPMDFPVLEILFYNMRHLQHHVAQLNMILRDEIDRAPKWIFTARNS